MANSRLARVNHECDDEAVSIKLLPLNRIPTIILRCVVAWGGKLKSSILVMQFPHTAKRYLHIDHHLIVINHLLLGWYPLWVRAEGFLQRFLVDLKSLRDGRFRWQSSFILLLDRPMTIIFDLVVTIDCRAVWRKRQSRRGQDKKPGDDKRSLVAAWAEVTIGLFAKSKLRLVAR